MPKNYSAFIHGPAHARHGKVLAVIKRLKHNGMQQNKPLVISVDSICKNTIVFQTALWDFKLQPAENGAEVSEWSEIPPDIVNLKTDEV